MKDVTLADALRATVIVLVLLAAGAALYAGFVKDVLDRGKDIVDISLKSKAARGPLQLAGAGILCMAASGLVSFARPLRGRRLSPLLGLGLALVPAALVGVTAFSLGRTSFMLALIVAAPSVLTLAIACLTPPRPRPGLGRFLLRSWMATGFLIGLTALALFGLELAEKARPRVPWASVFAALALGTLVQLAARFVAMHGSELDPVAKDHKQVRTVHETEAIRDVAARLHPFIEEGRDGDDYVRLAEDLGKVTRQPVPAVPDLASGPPTLPVAQAGAVAVLRATAASAPLVVVVPVLGWPAAVVAFGLALPFARMSLNPRKEPSPRLWWLAGAAVMAGGGAWAGSFLRAPGFERLTLPFGAALALPYLILFLLTLRKRTVPGHLAFLRLEHAKALGERWRRNVGRGLGVAAGSLGLPPALWLVSRMVGIRIHAVAWPVLIAIAAGGLLWALAGLLSGPAAARHRSRLGAQQAARVQARAAAHRTFLDRLEMT
ncbi:MAG: hypothetical protein AABY18_05480 [Candidatus Thermoplasmatota archaeon]